MKKKLLTILTLIAISAGTIACGNAESGNSENPKQSEETLNPSGENNSPSPDNVSKTDQPEAKQEELDVELNIPADFVGETTQEELDSLAKENGFKSITLNEDGSATYIMSKKQHSQLMDEYRKEINNSLDEILTSGSYPNFTKIEANDNFTEFTITTKSKELDLNESFSVMAFYIQGGAYNVFNGEPTNNISVTFVNEATGEVIFTSNSKDS